MRDPEVQMPVGGVLGHSCDPARLRAPPSPDIVNRS